MKRFLPLVLAGAALASAPLAAQTAPGEGPRKHAPRPTRAAITAEDLKTRVYGFTDDSMRGRAAGTRDNVRGAELIARELRRLGLRPAGEKGTFFQDVPLIRRTLSPSAHVTAGGTRFVAWKDFFPRDQGLQTRDIDNAEVVYGGTWADTASLIAREAAAGKLVVLTLGRDSAGQPVQPNRNNITNRFVGAAGIAVVSVEESSPDELALYRTPGLALPPTPGGAARPAYLYVNRPLAAALLGAPVESARPGATGPRVRGSLLFTNVPASARNVVAVLPGSNPALRGQYVAVGSHNDHLPPSTRSFDHDSLRVFNRFVRPEGADSPAGEANAEQAAGIRAALDSLRRIRPARRDSVYNGADDDGSGSMAMLEIAEALARAPKRPERSTLFIWHTAEEVGLLGAQWYTDHPTVPLDSIVANLNIDMLGRGGPLDGRAPGYLQLIGSRRLSTELGDIVDATNLAQRTPFTIDYSYDADGHPDNSYCRSDHYMYARYGVPVTFFSTGGHRDYHQVTDEAQYLNYEHFARATQLIHDVLVRVANLDHRVVVDKPKPDPNVPCRQ